MNALQIFQYNNTSIEFEMIDGQLYANATAMCQVFGKRPVDWMRLPATLRYVDALRAKCENLTSLTISKKGGIDGGGTTWIHEKLILKLAQWLDVEFEIWCDERVAEVLKGQSQSLPPQNYKEALQQIIVEIEKREAIEAENALLKPKAQYAEVVLSSASELTTTLVAKELGMSAVTLNKKLHERGVQFKQSGHWILYARHEDKGYAKLRTHTHCDSKGNIRTEHYLVWTEKGRAFIHSLFNSSLLQSAPMGQLAFA